MDVVSWDHSFDRHAYEWFGIDPKVLRRVRENHIPEWQNMIRQTARSGITGDWSTGQDATTFRLARVDGKWFAVQLSQEGERGGYLATAFMPGSGQLQGMLRVAGLK